MSKRVQKRSIDDNLGQLVLLRQDRVLVNLSTCFFTSDSELFFFTFLKKWVVRAMGNETFYGDGLIVKSLDFIKCNKYVSIECRKVHALIVVAGN